jgi:Rod binding domain-containing protein
MNISPTALAPPGTPWTDPAHLEAHGQAKDPRAIENVANGFEAIFASMLVKEMRQSLGHGSLFGGDKGDVLGGMFDYFLGQHVAPSGSLGIAAMIRKQMSGTKHT